MKSEARPSITAAGTALTEKILTAVAPLVHDQPSDRVIEAMAGAMMATLLAAHLTAAEQRMILRRYADRVGGFAGRLV